MLFSFIGTQNVSNNSNNNKNNNFNVIVNNQKRLRILKSSIETWETISFDQFNNYFEPCIHWLSPTPPEYWFDKHNNDNNNGILSLDRKRDKTIDKRHDEMYKNQKNNCIFQRNEAIEKTRYSKRLKAALKIICKQRRTLENLIKKGNKYYFFYIKSNYNKY